MPPFDPKRPSPPADPTQSPTTELTTSGGVRVIVRELPPPEPEEEPEPPEEFPRVIVMPVNQPARDRDEFIRWLNDRWGEFIRTKLLSWDKMNEASAEELTQQVLFVLSTSYDPRDTPENIKAFLEKTVEHQANNRHRRRQRRVEIEPGADADLEVASGPGPESAAEIAEQWEKILRYLPSLPPEEAQVFRLKEIERMTLDQIVAVVKRPRSTVARQHGQAIEGLRDLALESERETALGARIRPGR